MAADLSKSVQRLSRASEQLRESSEKLNGIILGLEQELRRIDPGVEVYLDRADDLIVNEVKSETVEELAARGTENVRASCIRKDRVQWRVGYQLGWARCGQRFSLVVRPASEAFDEDKWCEVEPLKDGAGRTPLTFLSAAPRWVRMAALPHLPSIVDAVSSRVEKFASDIDRALATVEADGLVVPAAADSWDDSRAPEADNDIPF